MPAKFIKYYTLRVCLLMLFITGCALEKDKMPDITCRIDPIKFNQAQIQMTITNHSKSDIQILSWFTPFEGFLSHMFDVKFNGNLLTYQGPMVKRGTPTFEDYFILPAGAARTTKINLGLIYDLSQSGEYSVQYRKQINARFTKYATEDKSISTEPTVGQCEKFNLTI
jgi:hypothetical protein